MNFYYTTVTMAGQPQNDPLYSLGGYCSSTPVPSDVDENLFSLISQLTLESEQRTYVGLVLKNDLETTCRDISLFLDSDLAHQWGKFRVAVVHLSRKDEMEHISGVHEKPKYANFLEIDGELQAIPLPDMEPKKMYGIWVERSINAENEEISRRNDCRYLFDHKDDVKRTNDRIDLVLNFEPDVI